MDCVRATDFPLSSDREWKTPFFDSLSRESIVYSNAVSPSPWTLPSHASLFSGLDPWQSGCNWKGDLRLDPTSPRLAGTLRDSGYRTLGLSANPLVSPAFNMSQGFDRFAWSAWWEPYVRFVAGTPHPIEDLTRSDRRGPAEGSRRTRLVDLFAKRSVGFFHKHPFLLDGGSRMLQGLHSQTGRPDVGISRWIEPTLESWIRDVEQSVPIYAFINLLEAHEPYFATPAQNRRLTSLMAYTRIRQDNIGFLAGEWSPRRGEFDALHDLYCYSISILDTRVRSIVEILKRSERWENTIYST